MFLFGAIFSHVHLLVLSSVLFNFLLSVFSFCCSLLFSLLCLFLLILYDVPLFSVNVLCFISFISILSFCSCLSSLPLLSCVLPFKYFLSFLFVVIFFLFCPVFSVLFLFIVSCSVCFMYFISLFFSPFSSFSVVCCLYSLFYRV